MHGFPRLGSDTQHSITGFIVAGNLAVAYYCRYSEKADMT